MIEVIQALFNNRYSTASQKIRTTKKPTFKKSSKVLKKRTHNDHLMPHFHLLFGAVVWGQSDGPEELWFQIFFCPAAKEPWTFNDSLLKAKNLTLEKGSEESTRNRLCAKQEEKTSPKRTKLDVDCVKLNSDKKNSAQCAAALSCFGGEIPA